MCAWSAVLTECVYCIDVCLGLLDRMHDGRPLGTRLDQQPASTNVYMLRFERVPPLDEAAVLSEVVEVRWLVRARERKNLLPVDA